MEPALISIARRIASSARPTDPSNGHLPVRDATVEILLYEKQYLTMIERETMTFFYV